MKPWRHDSDNKFNQILCSPELASKYRTIAAAAATAAGTTVSTAGSTSAGSTYSFRSLLFCSSLVLVEQEARKTAKSTANALVRICAVLECLQMSSH